jgi:hypothetical protein
MELQLVTWCALDAAGWRVRAMLRSGVTQWIPAPGPVTDAFASDDRYETLADVHAVAEWLATRWVRADPKPRSVAVLAGWNQVPVTDPRVADLRAAYLAALWWCRAITEFYEGVRTEAARLGGA